MKRFDINPFHTRYPLCGLLLFGLLTGCRDNVPTTTTADHTTGASLTTKTAPIFPEYGDSLVLPPNIAPLNFAVNEKIRLHITCGEETLLDKQYRRQVQFHPKAWKRFLRTARERQEPLRLDISTADRHYTPLHWFVAEDSIDPYLVYRLVVPTDGIYNILGIYQRRLSDFKTTALTLNTVSNNNCMNCHTFRNGDADEMMVHWRKPSDGTLIMNHDGMRKIVLPPKATQLNLRLTYPAYHPNGRYIAFSTNLLLGFACYEAHRRFFDAGDSIAHIVIYDIERNRLFSHRMLWQEDHLLSYPAWSPDGRTLYFCSAPSPYTDMTESALSEKQRFDSAKRAIENLFSDGRGTKTCFEKEQIERIRFDLACITFDPTTGLISDTIHTLLKADDYNGSFSLPRVNPADPNCIAVSIGTFSSFPSQTYGDLGLVFLNKTDTAIYIQNFQPADLLNTPEAESFHSWSQNGRWLVYTGKQLDGYFALPYIAYFDGQKFHKPFLLPQKEGDYYRSALKSFNLPELTVTPSKLTPKKTEKLRKNSYTLTVETGEIETLIQQLHESGH